MHVGERNFYLVDAFGESNFFGASVLRNFYLVENIRHNFCAVFRNVLGN